MLNEGMTTGNLPTEIKSIMVREIQSLGRTDSDKPVLVAVDRDPQIGYSQG